MTMVDSSFNSAPALLLLFSASRTVSCVALETTTYPHLDLSAPGQPLIAGKNFKLIHLIREHVAYGWSADELALNHSQLTLGEIYSALAYYADHREEIDHKISANRQKKTRNRSAPKHFSSICVNSWGVNSWLPRLFSFAKFSSAA